MKKKIFFLLIIFSFVACSDKSDALTDVKITNQLDPDNLPVIFSIDSIYVTPAPTTPKVRFYFHLNMNLIKDYSKVHKISIVRSGIANYIDTTPNGVFFYENVGMTRFNIYRFRFSLVESDYTTSFVNYVDVAVN